MNEPETLSALVDWAPNWVGPVAAVLFAIAATVFLADQVITGWKATAPKDAEGDHHETGPASD